jgi:ferritin-like metal-binding protein YciE
MSELRTRDVKLIQYLNEALGKENELETALHAHASMTTRAGYKRRLHDHLRETKRHASIVERRIKQLGGQPEPVPTPGPQALAKGASAAVDLASRAVAAAQGPLHAIRGTGEQEKMLKNAKSEYSNEHEEIATYTAIETLADSLGDSETAKLARAIRREEQRMAHFLERLIPTLTRGVVQSEIPAAERRSDGARRRPARRSSPAGRNGAGRPSTARQSNGASRRTTARSASRKTSKAR